MFGSRVQRESIALTERKEITKTMSRNSEKRDPSCAVAEPVAVGVAAAAAFDDGKDEYVARDGCEVDHCSSSAVDYGKSNDWMYHPSSPSVQRLVSLPFLEAEITVLGPASEPTPSLLEHWIQPSDTLSGLCLKYGITSTQLRQANFGFSGTNLSLAPNPLRIPNIQKAVPVSEDRDKLLQALMLLFREDLTRIEAKCYLELNDWDLNRSIRNVRQDLQSKEEWPTDPSGERARFDTPMEHVIIDEEIS